MHDGFFFFLLLAGCASQAPGVAPGIRRKAPARPLDTYGELYMATRRPLKHFGLELINRWLVCLPVGAASRVRLFAALLALYLAYCPGVRPATEALRRRRRRVAGARRLPAFRPARFCLLLPVSSTSARPTQQLCELVVPLVLSVP